MGAASLRCTLPCLCEYSGPGAQTHEAAGWHPERLLSWGKRTAPSDAASSPAPGEHWPMPRGPRCTARHLHRGQSCTSSWPSTVKHSWLPTLMAPGHLGFYLPSTPKVSVKLLLAVGARGLQMVDAGLWTLHISWAQAEATRDQWWGQQDENLDTEPGAECAGPGVMRCTWTCSGGLWSCE